MRNLLLIHLESLNYMNYQMNKEFFPTLQEWEHKSIVFSKYFSTATSTLMVLSDLAYGGMLQNEPCERLTSSLSKYYYESSLWDELKNNGYKVKAAGYSADGIGDGVGCNRRHFIGYNVELDETECYEFYLQSLNDAMTKEKAFAVWACNYISNVNHNSYVEGAERHTGLGRWENGYIYMDCCVKDLIDILEKKDLLEQTTIIFYGDHGDDVFSHGRHRGLMHAIEPYEALIHTPFWIYDKRFGTADINSLIDVTDIRKIIRQLLDLPDKKLDIKDLKMPVRKYSFARNVYAAQMIRETSFHKGYSLTDGKFLFMASDSGMELFHIGMDFSCQHNLLDYFDFKDDVLILNEALYNRVKFHFSEVMDRSALIQIEKIFYEFRKKLMQEVKGMYEYAECEDRYSEIDFAHIHYGWEERKRRESTEMREQSVISEIINQLLNCMQTNKLAVYGDVEDELKNVYPVVEKCRISRLIDSTGYEVIYIALKNSDELCRISQWINLNREKLTILLYIRDVKENNKETEKLYDITYKYHNETLLKGTLYFVGKIFEYPPSLMVPENFRVLAVIHFYNEADILAKTIEYLLSQDVDIYLVDNWSDDGSYEIAQLYKEKHKEHIFLERFPSMGSNQYYDWYHQLERTEKIAAETNYDWYIHYDADEMRVGPWKGRNLRETYYYINQLGYSAVDNTVIDFKLTEKVNQNIFMCDTWFDFRHSVSGFRQRKSWKKTDEIDLKKSGGHIARIKNPKIFPLKVLNRHYPLRSVEQAGKKVFLDRKPRFEKEKKERGWHGHYDSITSQKDLFADEHNLILWDETVWEQYYISLFLGCGIRIDDEEEFDIYRKYLEGKRIVLYGAGNYGRYFYEKMAGCADIVAWVDRDYEYMPRICCEIIKSVDSISDLEFDAVFIAIAKNKIRNEVKDELIHMGIPSEKIY